MSKTELNSMEILSCAFTMTRQGISNAPIIPFEYVAYHKDQYLVKQDRKYKDTYVEETIKERPKDFHMKLHYT